ncbi:MAG TPA: tripartite tricarboxylate transporter TctB family protein [Microvirga sp.]|jgi:hypothetical protein|nr:tripartite tricarboxylate transporter TctB family protein [Microvirga sp.]
MVSRSEVAFSLGLLVLGVWIVAQALAYGVFGPNITGAGFFPLIAGALLALSSAGTLVRQVRGRTESGRLEAAETLRIGGVVALTALFLVLVERVGLVLLTPFYVAVVAYLIEWPTTLRGHATVWATAIGFAIVAYLVFDLGLNVPLPDGFLGG